MQDGKRWRYVAWLTRSFIVAIKKFTYHDERDGLVAQYLAENPDGLLQYWPDGPRVLTGDDIPVWPDADEQPAQ